MEQKVFRSQTGKSDAQVSSFDSDASLNNQTHLLSSKSHDQKLLSASILETVDDKDNIIHDSRHKTSFDVSHSSAGDASSPPLIASTDEYQVTKKDRKAFCSETGSKSLSTSSSLSPVSASNLLPKKGQSLIPRLFSREPLGKKKNNQKPLDKKEEGRSEEEGVKDRDENRHRKESSTLVCAAPSTCSTLDLPTSSSSYQSSLQEVKETDKDSKEESSLKRSSLTSLTSLLFLINNFGLRNTKDDAEEVGGGSVIEASLEKKTCLNESFVDASDRRRTLSRNSSKHSSVLPETVSSLQDLRKNRSIENQLSKKDSKKNNSLRVIPKLKNSSSSSSPLQLSSANDENSSSSYTSNCTRCFHENHSSEVTIGSSSLPTKIPVPSASYSDSLSTPTYTSKSATFYLDSRSGLTFEEDVNNEKIVKSSNSPSSLTNSSLLSSSVAFGEKMNNLKGGRESNSGVSCSLHRTCIDGHCCTPSRHSPHIKCNNNSSMNNMDSFHDYFYGQDIPGGISVVSACPSSSSSCHHHHSSRLSSSASSSSLHQSSSNGGKGSVAAPNLRSDKRLKYNTVIDRLRKFAVSFLFLLLGSRLLSIYHIHLFSGIMSLSLFVSFLCGTHFYIDG
jgi:hypothetical protein